MKKLFFALLGLSVAIQANSQTTINAGRLDSVFVNSKTPMAVKDVGKVVTVITLEELRSRNGSSVSEIINEVAGIEINGSRSNDGQNLSYFVRGGSNRQVVVLIDGVPVMDASQIANDFDLRLLPVSDVSRIEIIKGASSVLYGSGAGTVVISIRTRGSSEKDISANFSSSIATNRAADEGYDSIGLLTNAVRISGSPGRFVYGLNFSNRYANGLSAIAPTAENQVFDSDVFNKYNGRIRLGYRFGKGVEISRFLGFDKFKAGFDNFDYTDADHRSSSEQLRTGGRLVWRSNVGVLTFNDSYTTLDREIESGFPAIYESETFAYDVNFNFGLAPILSILTGVQGSSSSFDSFTIPFGTQNFEQVIDASIAKYNITDPYINVDYRSGFGFNFNGGARLNIHSTYDTHLVYSFNPSFNINFGENNLRVIASYGTAYITPSLFQLYDPLYANEELLPEENRTIESGIVINSAMGIDLSVVYFNRKETNYIDFVLVDPDLFLYQYQNVFDEYKADGLEVEVKGTIGQDWSFNSNYTLTKVAERFSIRIPKHKLNVKIGCNPTDFMNFLLRFQYVAERDDVYFDPITFENKTVVLKEFKLIRFNSNFKINEVVSLSATVDNLFNEDYEELYRYQARGRNFRLGLSLNFE